MSAFTRLYYANRGPGGTEDPFELPADAFHDPREQLLFPDDPYRMAGHSVEARASGPDMRGRHADPRQPRDAHRARALI
jgi:hypothetical protein